MACRTSVPPDIPPVVVWERIPRYVGESRIIVYEDGKPVVTIRQQDVLPVLNRAIHSIRNETDLEVDRLTIPLGRVGYFLVDLTKVFVG